MIKTTELSHRFAKILDSNIRFDKILDSNVRFDKILDSNKSILNSKKCLSKIHWL